LLCGFDSRSFEIERFDVRCTAGRHEKRITRHACVGKLSIAVAAVMHADLSRRLAATFDRHAELELHAVLLHVPAHAHSRVGVFRRKRLRVLIEDSNVRSETCVRLRELATDRSRAEHEKPPRELGQGKDCLVCQERNRVESLNWRCGWPSARRDDRSSKAKATIINRDSAPVDEPCRSKEHVDAGRAEPFRGVLAGTQTSRANRANEPGSASAKHDEVVRGSRRGGDPARRMNMGQEPDIVVFTESLNLQIHHRHNTRDVASGP
jgi:hypothetical protein